MPHRIQGDHKDFIDVYSGRIRRELKKYINNGSIFRFDGKGGKINITIPKIDIPHIVFGDSDEGIGRGKGKEGDVFKKDPQEGQGQQAGQEEADGITISIDLEIILKFLQDELQLPNLLPKPNQTYEDIRIKYNDIALTGPESLRHNRRTMLQALKRMCASGEINQLHMIPGFKTPVRLITPHNSDKRYRQYREIKIPASNAIIFFARDGSASMDEHKCDIISDMAWWIDVWIRQFYKRVERCYIWHDTVAQEVDEKKFYRYRYGGGTICSSALKFIAKQFENRFPPEKWNVYIFYFTDGENSMWPSNDNDVFCKVIEEQFPSSIVNLIAVTQVLADSYQDSVKEAVDKKFGSAPNVRTTAISIPDRKDDSSSGHVPYGTKLSDEERDFQVRRAIIEILGKEKTKKDKADKAA